jgi:hypothetical protein
MSGARRSEGDASGGRRGKKMATMYIRHGTNSKMEGHA